MTRFAQFTSRQLLTLIGAIGIAIAVALVAAERTVPPAICDGQFSLSMSIVSDSGARVKSVGYFICGHSTGVADFLVRGAGAEHFESAMFDGHAWNAAIWCSWRERWSGYEFGYSEAKLLVLNIVCDDGRATRQVVEIPPGRGARQTFVTVP